MDPTAKPSQPLPLYRHDTPTPHDLLSCLQHCMQALPSQPRAALAPMLADMVQAASRVVSAADVQALCAHRGITFIEAQSIAVYTMDARDYARAREDSVFFVFNLAVRTGDSEQVQRWSAYTKLFSDALDKLPSVSCVVFRGLDQPLTQVSHLYVKASTVFFNSVTSTTTDKAGTLLQFGMGADGRPGTLLQIAACDVKDIAVFSVFRKENELLAPLNSSYRVVTVLESAEVRCRVSRAGACCVFEARLAQVQALAAFGDLPKNVDLIVMQQLPHSSAHNVMQVPTSTPSQPYPPLLCNCCPAASQGCCCTISSSSSSSSGGSNRERSRFSRFPAPPLTLVLLSAVLGMQCLHIPQPRPEQPKLQCVPFAKEVRS